MNLNYNIGNTTFSGASWWVRWVCTLALVSAAALEAAGPESVLVVVNANSGLSRRIGDYYARRRAIPRANICTIRTPDRETVNRETYQSTIASSVAACLESKRLVESILYIVTTQGVPLRVAGTSSTNGEQASVDSELTLLYQALHGQPLPTAGTVSNPFFGQHDAVFRHPQFPIYLVTRLAAYDFPAVKGLIDRSMAAKNEGRVVLDTRGPGPDRSGDLWLRNAAALLPPERVVLEATPAVLHEQKSVIGYGSWGSNDRSRKERKLGFQWLPGAIATEYVSTNARTFAPPPDTWRLGSWSDKASWFTGSPQSLTADLIAEGATGASGHVYEPYLHLTPRPDYLFPAYLGGRNLAESYYLAIPALSWQNIVVGDPLCVLR